jgi:homopolymeric O-antigen transport system ATP-binding protein
MANAIEAHELSKRYRIGQMQAAYGTLRDSLSRATGRLTGREKQRDERQEIWALRDVSFRVREGEVLGVIGRNGAGKSTLLKILTRITTPTTGRAVIQGRVGSLLEVGTGFNPELTGRENVFLNGSILGMKRKEIQRKLPNIVEFSGIDKFIDTPVKRYSSGMYVRLAFSVAAHLEPEILLVDEVLAVGDAEFQQRCLGRMEDFSGTGRTVLFVSHNMQTINQLCNRVIWLDEGGIAEDGDPSQVVTHYLHSTSYATGAHISWPDDETAPGDDLVRLLAVRAIDEDGNLTETVDVREAVGIEIRYRILKPGSGVFTKIRVRDRRSDIAFNAMDITSHSQDSSEPGIYTATAWIPGNLLNEGKTTVDVAVCTLRAPKLHQRAARYEAVLFNVFDPGDGDSARGLFTGQLSGVVRPLLEWSVERVD